eukprot:TRINITY_DN8282_c0_g1_i1.p1 TRINITY_DN8282_c0_g1~~TRINITY_DN8282_c0_g1_i1.p1  ORF type:complete len:377 (-),score=50.88 TRINITY_DN8282_c0_g1_i1:971-2101(-)
MAVGRDPCWRDLWTMNSLKEKKRRDVELNQMEPEPSICLASLPVELVASIAAKLPIQAVNPFASCCKSLYLQLESDFTWSYLICEHFGADFIHHHSAHGSISAPEFDIPTMNTLPGRWSVYKRMYILLRAKSLSFMKYVPESPSHPMPSDFDLFSVFLIGSYGCGKRSMLARFMDNEFFEGRIWNGPAIEFRIARFQPDPVNANLCEYRDAIRDKQAKVLIWFPTYWSVDQWKRNFRPRSAGDQTLGLVFCFSLDNQKTFDELQEIMDYHFNAEDSWRHRVLDSVLVGLKAENERAVSPEDITACLRRFKLRRYFEVSSKENKNVGLMFENLATQLVLKFHQHRQQAEAQNEDGQEGMNQQENADEPTSSSWCSIS